MIDEHDLVTVGRFDGNAYKRSQAAEITLNTAILRAEIARSYEEFLEIFKTFYADDVEVSSEDSRKTIRGKARVRPFLLNFLVPLHVMAEVAGLSVSIQQTTIPGDTADETHSAWRIDFTGIRGKRCCWPVSEEPRSPLSPGVSMEPGLTAFPRMRRSFK